MRPAYLRVVVDWATVQPTAGGVLRWDVPQSGCLRDASPCGPYAGIRDELRAIASEQRAGGGFQVVVVLQGTPAWAAEAPRGCAGPLTPPRARAPRPDALPALQTLVASLLGLARAQGVELRWWSPWNEPNHPDFLNPQRASCTTDSPPLAPALYARLVRTVKAELDDARGDQSLVLGDLAGLRGPRPRGAGVAEFVKALPPDVACGSAVWAQHGYVGGRDTVHELLVALDARGCPERAHAWVTETGVGQPHGGKLRDTAPGALRRQCRALHRQLLAWDRDPRVDAAFQYSFREDPQFPVGLMDVGLARTYAPLADWQGWGGTRPPDGPPPPLPQGCRG